MALKSVSSAKSTGDNIAAISTALGAAGVAVIRISGDSPLRVAEKMFIPSGKTAVKDFAPNVMYAGEIAADGFSDYGMCVYFKAPKSFTGEDTVEIHSHGGVAITKGILDKILSLGVRLATNGEFTKRAFMNGKLSLSSAEGLIDMINSESVGGVKAGYALYREKLNGKVSELQEKLLASLSEIDASLDFPEEGLEELSEEKVKTALKTVIAETDGLIATFDSGRKVAHGVKVAICGRPNVGKSSLLNALLSYDRAIVSDVPGTTRDVVDGAIDVNGVTFRFYDTAGIRVSDDKIENLGVDLAKKTIDSCDIAIFMTSAEKITEEDENVYRLIKDLPHICVINKTDLFDGSALANKFCGLKISAKTGDNIDELRRELFTKTVGKVDMNGDFLCEERHFIALKNAREKLVSAYNSIGNASLDLISVDVTDGWRYLGEISGKTATEDVIDDIFSRFCVGK